MNGITNFFLRLVGVLVLLASLGGVMQADIGLMLNKSLREGASNWTGAGHSTVYLSGVCAATPVTLRLCRPGENGVVLSNYQRFGENQSFEWNAIPLNVYLYGVEDEADRPIYASETVRWMLQERYRQNYLKDLCTDACATDPNAQWRIAVASTFLRDIYMFTVKTTHEQDLAMIEKFNREENVSHYNGFTYNCADFARDVVNTYFPHAAKPDRLNDFLMTSPKGIARSFVHYAQKHPELGLHVMRFTQIPGEFPSSRDNRNGTEQLYMANRWRIPLAVLLPHELMAATASYLITARFNPETELRRRPTDEVTALQESLHRARLEDNDEAAEQDLQKIRAIRANVIGTREEWSGYETTLRQYKSEAVKQGLLKDEDELKGMGHELVSRTWMTMDDRGGLWLAARDGQQQPKVAFSASTLLDTRSDARSGYLLMMSRVEAELHRKRKNREILPYFRQDWELMEALRERAVPMLAGSRQATTTSGVGSSSKAAEQVHAPVLANSSGFHDSSLQ